MTTDPPEQPTVAAVFDEGAIVYARHWAPVLNRHALDLVASVPPPEGPEARTVLDVAAGAGTLLPALRPLAGEGGQLVALDYSAGMLALADASIARIQADAARLPLRAACADVAVYAFVLFLLPDARAAVAEAARVTRPGGWLLAATWGAQHDNAADVVVREEIDATGSPPVELPRSDELTDTPHKMRALLEAGGFTEVTTSTRPLDARFDIGSVLAMRTGFGSLGWRYARLTPEAQERVLDRAAAGLATLPPEAFTDQSEVLLTHARRAQ